MVRVQLIAKSDPWMTGTSRYAAGLYQGLREAGVDVHLTFPDQLPVPGPVVRSLKWLGVDLRAFFAGYPLRVHLDQTDVYHITAQTMATLLWCQRFPAPVVVTVLDIIPYLVRHDPKLNTSRHVVDRLFYWLALSGLRRADALIAISEYTKQTLIEALSLPAERIHVVYPAVDHRRFRPLKVPDNFRTKYGLNTEWRYILYVGSDDPRKNLYTLVRSLALVKQRIPNVKMLKVGTPHFTQERKMLLALAVRLGIHEGVLFFDEVPDEDLPLFYNLADVFVMPSLYEGFGFPVAEAMACETPTIVSSAASLPEVVGAAGVIVSPMDTTELANQICRILLRNVGFNDLARAGRERAQRFRLSCQAEATRSIYARIWRKPHENCAL